MATTKRQCRAIASSTEAQCENQPLPGTPYCWWHQAKISSIALFVVGLVGGFFLEIGKDRIRERYFEPKPEISVAMNGEILDSDNLVTFDPQATNLSLSFQILNSGKAAENCFLGIQCLSIVTNIISAPDWTLVPLVSVAEDGNSLASEPTVNYRWNIKLPITTSNIITISRPIGLNVTDCKTIGMSVRIGGSNFETKRHRVHFLRQFSSATNTLRGQAVEDVLRNRHPTNYYKGVLLYRGPDPTKTK